jgi:tRNA(His) 5'-end guanylyltransferase
MKFDDFDARMRRYETAHDQRIEPDMPVVVRLDGRAFTTLTRDRHQFEAPFDAHFRYCMVATSRRLMDCGFKSIYAYTQSDEISLLLHPRDGTFGRKSRKIISVLAGEASAAFSLALGDTGVFDARLCLLPTVGILIDYFRWRQEDAHRNALNSHCYWRLREEGLPADKAHQRTAHLSTAEKNELLFERGINFNSLPAWQKRGVGLYYEDRQKQAVDPRTDQSVVTSRRRIKVDMALPIKNDYGRFVRSLMAVSSSV